MFIKELGVFYNKWAICFIEIFSCEYKISYGEDRFYNQGKEEH